MENNKNGILYIVPTPIRKFKRYNIKSYWYINICGLYIMWRY